MSHRNRNRKREFTTPCPSKQDGKLSLATVETDDHLQFITGGGSGQDPRQRVLDQLDHEIDQGELNRWFVANHGRSPGSATTAFFEAAAVWIEKAYHAGLRGLPLSHVIPWLKRQK